MRLFIVLIYYFSLQYYVLIRVVVELICRHVSSEVTNYDRIMLLRGVEGKKEKAEPTK